MSIAAIIPAAGIGTRMGGDRPKQFFELGGVAILIRTLRKFHASPLIDRIVVALRGDERVEFSKLLAAESFEKPVDVVLGGDHRQESVARALRGIDARVFEWVVVHDAVRPLFDPLLIESVLSEARKTGAAICAIPVLDTIKQIDRQRVIATLPRDRIVLVQTPQAFRTDLLRQSFEKAETENFFGTDESMLMEHLGIEVGVVMGCERNIKITRPSDLSLAEFYLGLESPGRGSKP
ncbi:MAG: 2-C-methyl-D-erythritol 4-phosphate cytidylyltransferase [Terriglobia bacterium]